MSACLVTVPIKTRMSTSDSQERLRKVLLDPPTLMVQIVVLGIVPKDRLEGIPPDIVSTVVVHRLDRAYPKEDDGLSDGHACCRVSQDGTERVQEEAFDGVVVESSKCVGDVETVVHRVEMAVEEGNRMEESVEEVLPSVDDEAARSEYNICLSVSTVDSSRASLYR
jgi:hypothetical protein